MCNVRVPTAISLLLLPWALHAQAPGEGMLPSPQASRNGGSSWFYSGAPAFVDDSAALTWRSVRVKPFVTYRISHSSGRPGVDNTRGATTIHRFSPGVALDFLGSWTLRYMPTWTWYSARNYADKVSHDLELRGTERLGIGVISFSQTYLKSNEANVETGRQTGLSEWETSLAYSRPLTSRLSATIAGSQDLRYTTSYSDTREWYATAGLNYQVLSPLLLGVSGSSGYDDVDPGANSRWHRGYLTAQWQLSNKISIGGQAGYENRKTATTPEITFNGPIYSANLNYRLTTSTTVFASTAKSFGTSLFEGSTTERRRNSLGFKQLFFQRVGLSVSASEGTTDYTGGVTQGRRDRSSSENVTLTVPYRTRLELSFFYHHTKNRSNQDFFDLNTEEYGASVSYRF